MDFVEVWEGFLCWVELHPGLASWVQAVGAIISIWAAWWIANRQIRKVELEKRHSDLAKCTAVLSVFEYVLLTVKNDNSFTYRPRNGNNIRESLSEVLLMLGRIDILSLPDPIIVNALFEVRRSVEILDFKVRDYLLSGRDLIDDHYYKYKLISWSVCVKLK
ncbi:hypothetical protein ACTXOX_21485 [Pseudomonas helleri]|uniref:hypothetical protein n=1 Tax=Pseudomonas helleri TaxID=1608996 RepID=UPI003FD48CF4